MLKLFHAIDTIDDGMLRSVDVSHEVIRANRFDSRLLARDRIAQLIGALDSTRPRWLSTLNTATPPTPPPLHLRATQAELVVVGKPQPLIVRGR